MMVDFNYSRINISTRKLLRLEDSEYFLDVHGFVGSGHVLDHVEFHCFRQGTALPDGYYVPFSNVLEGGRAVNRQISMPLAKTSVLRHILQVISSDH
jgi:hypothetical protein